MFTQKSHNLRTLQDVMAYTITMADERYEEFGMKNFEAASRALNEYETKPERYQASLDRRLHIGKQIPELLEREQCDVLVVPSWTETTANIGGCPQISIPIGKYPSDFRTKSSPSDGRLLEGPGIP